MQHKIKRFLKSRDMFLKSEVKKQILKRLRIEDFYKHLNNNWTRNSKHIFIACLPKSGSTFLADVLVQISEYKFIQFQPIRGTNDHNINYDLLLSYLNEDTVTQLHTKPNDHNKLLFENYNMKIVFLYRSILDSLKSFHSHLIKENDRWFMFSVAENFQQWSTEKQFDFIIDLVAPWYIDFIVSWKKEVKINEIDVLEIDFDDFKLDNKRVIGEILDFYCIEKTNDRINSGLKKSMDHKEKLRFNSRSSRSTYQFSETQITKVEKLLSYYPEHEIKL